MRRKQKICGFGFGKSNPQPPNLYIGDNMIERVDTFKLLGVGCQSNMKWNSHKEITRKGNSRLHHLRQCRKADLPKEVGLATYCTKIRLLLAYAGPVWGGIPLYLMNDLERVQRRSLRVIGLPVDTLPPLCERIEKLTLREMEAITRDTNHACYHLVPVAHSHGCSTRTLTC